MTTLQSKRSITVLAFYAAVVLFLASLWYWESYMTDMLAGKTLLSKYLRYVGDAALVCLPFVFFKPKWRWTLLIPVYVSTLWVIGCLWYFRQWGDLPGVSALFLASNAGTTLFRAILVLWHPVDLCFFGALALLTFVYVRFVRPADRITSFRPALKAVLSSGLLILFALGQYISTHVMQMYHMTIQQPLTFWQATFERVTVPIDTNKYDLYNGPLIHFIKSAADAVQILTLKKPLTAADATRIEAFIASRPADVALIPDSIVEANSRKNIVLVIVESLNSSAISDSLDSRPVAPVMTSLIDSEGTISALNVVSQVGCGCSSDGHIMINTGLLPLRKFPAVMALGSTNTFPTLTEAFGRRTNCVAFADNGKSWNKFNTFRSFGFDPVYAEPDFADLIDREGKDGALFSFASNIVDTIARPFFLELLTLSMHSPFDDPTVPDEKLAITSRDAFNAAAPAERYLTMVRYFDAELGRFIDHLKARGLYDDTLLIIVSDHSQEVTTGKTDAIEQSNPMALIIANCGVTAKIDRTVGEIDVYPTILALTGARSLKGWQGVGRSILNPDVTAAITPVGIIGSPADSVATSRLSDAVGISELILRSNYFAR